jgi:hypothetical protein
VRIRFRWLKGKRDGHKSAARKFKPLIFLIESPSQACNLIADLPSLLYTGLEHGRFGKDKTIRDLLADPYFRLQHDPIVTKLPVFLRAAGPNNQELYSSNPIDSPDLKTLLKAACREVGLQCRVCMYVWRRGFLAPQGTHQTMLQDNMLIIHATISGIVRLRTIMTMVLVIKTSLLCVLGRTWNRLELFGTA